MHTRRSVEDWIAETATAAEVQTIATPSGHKKRLRHSIEINDNPTHKKIRLALGELHTNPTMPPRTPLKSSETPRNTPGTATIAVYEDPDATPRAQKDDGMSTRSYANPAYPQSDTSSDASSPTKRSNTTASSDRSHKRLKAGILRSLPQPIQVIQISASDANPSEIPPPLLQQMFEKVRRFSVGYNVLPPRFRDELKQVFGYELPHLYDHDGSRAKLGETPPLKEIDAVCASVRELKERKHSEAAWNEAVQYPLAKWSHRLSPFTAETNYINVTTANISKPLLPADLEGLSIPGKRVDYALVLRSSTAMLDVLRRISPLPATKVKSLNQSEFDPISDTPITMSIETKRTGESYDAAQQQLSVWAAAQFKRLRLLAAQLNKSGVRPPPFLPLIIVQGPRWELLGATQESTLDVQDSPTTIWSSVYIGDASSRLGVFQILATLQLLMEWSVEVYLPWFESLIA